MAAAAKKTAKKTVNKTANKTSGKSATKATGAGGFSDDERAAMKDRAAELRAERRGANKADQASAVVAKIAELTPADRTMAERVHAIITETAPALSPKLWYGMPAYAKDGKVVCFFQGAVKFKARYSLLGFNDAANLDKGAMWPTSFALAELTPEVDKQIRALVKRAVR